MNEPKQEYGWRMLADDEPILPTDEMWTGVAPGVWGGQGWAGFHGEQCTPKKARAWDRSPQYQFRRRIAPGEGWELVPEGEAIRDGDEYITKSIKQWTKAETTIGCFAGLSPMDHPGPFLAFRRRISSGWVKCSERLPEANRPFWVWAKIRGIVCFERGVSEPDYLKMHDWRIWRYCEGNYQIPPPPEPEKSAAEKAWEAEDPLRFVGTRAAFICGFEKGAQSKC